MKKELTQVTCPKCFDDMSYSNWTTKSSHKIEQMIVKCPTCNQKCIPTKESFIKLREDSIAISCLLLMFALPLALGLRYFWFDNSMFIIVFACTPLSMCLKGYLTNRIIIYEKYEETNTSLNP